MADRRTVLDFPHAIEISKARVCNLDMATAPVGAGGLKRRYAVRIQLRGLAVGKIERIAKSRHRRKSGIPDTTRLIGIRQRGNR